jgi:hypothetical protein
MAGKRVKTHPTAAFPPCRGSTEFRENFWFRTDAGREIRPNAAL